MPKQIKVLGVRELTREDLLAIKAKRNVPAVARMRDPHHLLARLIASGLKVNEAALRSGFSCARAYQLHSDPSFQELVQSYRNDVHTEWKESLDPVFDLANSNMFKAERQIAEKLDKADEEGELLPTKDLLAISRDAMDRFGYGKKTTNLNINVDFAARLEAARANSRKTIETRVNSSGDNVIEGTFVRRI